MEPHEQEYPRLKQVGAPGWGGAQHDARFEHWKKAIQELMSSGSIPEHARILDLGCGTGDISLHLASLGHEVLGLDISPTAIVWAEERAAACADFCPVFRVQDVRDLGFLPTESFDVVLDGNCLHCLIEPEDRASAMESVYRVLRRNGLFYVSTMCGYPAEAPRGTRFNPASGLLQIPGLPPRHLAEAETILNELRAAGFRIADYGIATKPWWGHLTVRAFKN